MPKKIKVRFNLGRGENYMKWKLQFETHSEYYSPEEYNLAMFGCTLRNSKKTAQKIHSGAHKTVCAWILCDQVFLTQNIQLPEVEAELKYNPRFSLTGSQVMRMQIIHHSTRYIVKEENYSQLNKTISNE